jgi:hypothetical protein
MRLLQLLRLGEQNRRRDASGLLLLFDVASEGCAGGFRGGGCFVEGVVIILSVNSNRQFKLHLRNILIK